MRSSLDELNHCLDIATLRGRLKSLCTRFGTVTRLDIIDSVQAGRRQAMCFLRMESADEEQRFSSELGVGRFGGDLVVIVDLNANQAAKGDNQPAGRHQWQPALTTAQAPLSFLRVDAP